MTSRISQKKNVGPDCDRSSSVTTDPVGWAPGKTNPVKKNGRKGWGSEGSVIQGKKTNNPRGGRSFQIGTARRKIRKSLFRGKI